jgi:tRNA (guanine-N7-)-methyltransferase
MRYFAEEKIPKPALNLPGFEDLQPLDIEIGAGQGLHAMRYCQNHPERQLLAIEKTHQRFARLAGRHAKHPELTNLHVVQADAVALITHHIADESLNRVFLLYPNPYPKAKQANLRWHNRPFLSLLLRKMQPGAQLILATNEASYATEAATQYCETWGMKLLEHQQLSPNWEPRTHFERKYLARGETCWNLIFCKSI